MRNFFKLNLSLWRNWPFTSLIFRKRPTTLLFFLDLEHEMPEHSFKMKVVKTLQKAINLSTRWLKYSIQYCDSTLKCLFFNNFNFEETFWRCKRRWMWNTWTRLLSESWISVSLPHTPLQFKVYYWPLSKKHPHFLSSVSPGCFCWEIGQCYSKFPMNRAFMPRASLINSNEGGFGKYSIVSFQS